MSNPYYVPTGDPVVLSRAGSAAIRGEFKSIEAGFNSLQVVLALKVSRSGDNYTGAHDFTKATLLVAPPVAPRSPVTKEYAESLAFSAVLPGQSGNAGKVLTTDGVDASWAAPLVSVGSVLYLYSNAGGF